MVKVGVNGFSLKKQEGTLNSHYVIDAKSKVLAGPMSYIDARRECARLQLEKENCPENFILWLNLFDMVYTCRPKGEEPDWREIWIGKVSEVFNE
jgi:hypothetical protein